MDPVRGATLGVLLGLVNKLGEEVGVTASLQLHYNLHTQMGNPDLHLLDQHLLHLVQGWPLT